MVKSKYLRLFTGIATGALLMWVVTSCEGPMGPDGKPGTNGTNGTNGIDANSSCLTCHTQANWDTLTNQYHLSKHYYGNTVARAQASKYCARCHSNDGFQEITGDGQFVVANEMPNATRISCETCHKHSGFDFPGDTASDILRTTNPVSLNYNNHNSTTDFGKINNLCVTCHQIRGVTLDSVYNQTKVAGVYTTNKYADKTFKQLPFFPMVSSDPTVAVQYKVGQSFSVHDGNQSNLFKGINAYEYPGVTYTRTWQHSNNSCTDCHMNKVDLATQTGGHSLKPNETTTGCAKCHTSDHLATTRASVSALLTQLGDLLTARKVFKKTVSNGVATYTALNTHDFNGKLLGSGLATDTFAISLTGTNLLGTGLTLTGVPTTSVTGTIVYRSDVTYKKDSDFGLRIGRAWKSGELGAAYNFGYINSELSQGIHNPGYAIKVLQSSIDWLNANP